MRIVLSWAIVVAVCAPVHAQTGVNGTWRIDGDGRPFPWEVVLRADGPQLKGAVNSCFSISRVLDIFDATINGTAVAFKCRSNDGLRTVTFNGTVRGDEIDFKRTVQTNDPRDPRPDALFGSTAPTEFVVRRVADGELAKAVDQVRGARFAAAVNLAPEDFRADADLFVPDGVTRVRSLIVVLDYALGSEVSTSQEWKKLAVALDAGILGVRFTGIRDSQNRGLSAANDQHRNRALLGLLPRLAQDSGRPELNTAPFVFWGHSGGATAVGVLASQFPNRTIAFVRYHIGGGIPALAEVSRIPALLMSGGKEENRNNITGAEALWKQGRATDAPWTLALDPDSPHGDEFPDFPYLKRANALMIPWITAVARQRVPAEGGPLRAVTNESAWIGNNATGEIMPARTLAGPAAEVSWLPDEASARGWRAVVRPAPIPDRFFPAVSRDAATPALGVWRGTVINGTVLDAQQIYGVEIQLQRLVPGEPAGKSLYYGQVNCGGSLSLLERRATGIYVFIEKIDTAGSGCVDGQVHLRFLDNERFHYEWHAQPAARAGSVPPSATLDRKVAGQ